MNYLEVYILTYLCCEGFNGWCLQWLGQWIVWIHTVQYNDMVLLYVLKITLLLHLGRSLKCVLAHSHPKGLRFWYRQHAETTTVKKYCLLKGGSGSCSYPAFTSQLCTSWLGSPQIWNGK